ncbi:MAG: type VI secretion system-associated FHA domain protein TagH [Sphingobium sp.]|uniref:type VI secretion system-associated FHA domain protein TagH n=1 Tax=Sphingobium sp. TaxID=1912891 RepID=UPI0029B62BB7|nr:type VI secretion system-associated FHA domain protein TagH [Sphingobium sp.]MDX3909613.1 type VI secretion system-associated FHA domain protein TagH [Sphingobium sp.]
MYIFKLFEQDDMQQAVDARMLQDGALRIGRDPQADWVMNDPSCEISRWHCEYHAREGDLFLRCMGANGVFDGKSGARLPLDSEICITVPNRIRFGRYVLVADHAVQGRATVDEGQTLILSPPLGSSIAVPTEWADGSAPIGSAENGSLFEAFCEGAAIDASAFSAENPEQVMRRAGAVYRQMVLGLGDLMAERERVRGQYQLARTTIGGTNNNPFKWAPTQRLAIDLLLAEDHGFLSGPSAIAASFRDIKKHLIATFGGLRASLRAAVQAFDPADIASATAGGSFLKSRAATNWETACERHADLVRQIVEGEDGSLNQVFVGAYDAAALELEAECA